MTVASGGSQDTAPTARNAMSYFSRVPSPAVPIIFTSPRTGSAGSGEAIARLGVALQISACRPNSPRSVEKYSSRSSGAIPGAHSLRLELRLVKLTGAPNEDEQSPL